MEKEKQSDSVWSSFDKKQSTKTSTPTTSAIIELRQYFEEVNINRTDDPLKWWKTRESVYPNLSKIAKKYLGIVATSVPSERVFSKAGQVVTERRNRLKANNVQKLIFLNANINLV